jgi:hypothetical protein
MTLLPLLILLCRKLMVAQGATTEPIRLIL